MKKKRKGSSRDVDVLILTQQFFSFFSRPLLLAGLLLSIPGFYLLLEGGADVILRLGRMCYWGASILMAIDTAIQWHKNRVGKHRKGKLALDVGIIIGCVLSGWLSFEQWGLFEWLLRLTLCVAILLRLATLILQHITPGHLAQMVGLAILMLTSAGAGFYWLEPNVDSYANGVWLAFTTVATVGYGDIVPSTPASKIFAVFIVLFGYAMFSIVTANIAALFVGEEEAEIEHALHHDIRALAKEVAALREELKSRDSLVADLALQVGHTGAAIGKQERSVEQDGMR